jgi:hypothetical protein
VQLSLTAVEKMSEIFSTAAKEFSLQLRFEKMQTKVSIFFRFFFCFFCFFNSKINFYQPLTCQSMISETLAAVEKKTEISDFFQLRIRILRYCGKKRISETLAAVDFFSKISDFFSTGAKGFLWMPKNGQRYCGKKNLKPLAAVDFFSKISDFFSTAAKVFCGCPKKGELYCGKKII